MSYKWGQDCVRETITFIQSITNRLDGHEFEQAPGVGDGHGSLECCRPWGHKQSDTTEQLN